MMLLPLFFLLIVLITFFHTLKVLYIKYICRRNRESLSNSPGILDLEHVRGAIETRFSSLHPFNFTSPLLQNRTVYLTHEHNMNISHHIPENSIPQYSLSSSLSPHQRSRAQASHFEQVTSFCELDMRSQGLSRQKGELGFTLDLQKEDLPRGQYANLLIGTAV